MKRMSGEAKPRKRPPSRYYLSDRPLEARHQSEDPSAAGSTRERGFREGAMVSADTCLFVKNWTFLVTRHWRRDQWLSAIDVHFQRRLRPRKSLLRRLQEDRVRYSKRPRRDLIKRE